MNISLRRTEKLWYSDSSSLYVSASFYNSMMITRLLVILVEIYLVCYKDKEKFGKYYFRLGNCTNPAVFLCSSGNEATSSDNDKSVKLVHNHTTYFSFLYIGIEMWCKY
jgi:hypothetical protein